MNRLLFTERLTTDGAHAATDDADCSWLALPFERRQRSRLRVQVQGGPLAGEAVGIDLPRGTVLRSGDLLRDGAGALLRIEAAPEALIEVVAGSPRELARLAYHLGNRHVAVQVLDDRLRIQADHVLSQMVAGLGGTPVAVEAAFEPEGGAYDQTHAHGHSHSHADDHSHAHSDHHHHDHTDDHEAIGAHRHHDRRHAPRIHDMAEVDPAARAPDDSR